MVTNTVEDLLEPNKRSQYPCVFNYKRLISILAKYRCLALAPTENPFQTDELAQGWPIYCHVGHLQCMFVSTAHHPRAGTRGMQSKHSTGEGLLRGNLSMIEAFVSIDAAFQDQFTAATQARCKEASDPCTTSCIL